MSERKTSKKMTAAQEKQLIALLGKVMTSRYPILQTLSKDELVSRAAYLEVVLLCECIARDKAREKRVNPGGRKATKKAIESNRLVPNAIADLLLADQEITFNNIVKKLAEYPEVRDAKLDDEPYSDYAVKEYLAAYNKLLNRPSLDEGGLPANNVT
jgi:hypothetical protein